MLAERILIDGFDGAHMWDESEKRPTVETPMDLSMVSFIQSMMAGASPQRLHPEWT